MSGRKNFALFLVLIVLGASFAQSCKKEPQEEKLDVVLEREIPKLMEAADVPGLSIAVIRDGQIFWTRAFGVQSRETNVPVDDNTMFEAASLTKTITAYVALRLVERGELDMDRPLFEYFPNKEYKKLAGDERYKQLTGRIVLTHTTGLPNWGSKLIKEPGKQYGYSGEGFLYLGRTIEQISGMSLQEFAQKEIFEPLGMTHTSYVWNDVYEENGASGHDRHGVAHQKRKNTEPNGGASLLTTAHDYATFLCAILNNQGLGEETIDQMISPQVKTTKWGKDELDENISWGWGWGVQPGNAGYGFWHWGDNGDLRAYTVTYKDRGEGLVYFSNSNNGLSIAKSIVALVMDDPQWTFEWLDYKQHDDPEMVAGLSVEKAFLEEGKEAGLQKIQEVRGNFPDLFKEELLTEMAQYLDERGKGEEAVAVYKICLEAFPESVDAYLGLGMANMGLDRIMEALENFERALKIAPDNRMAERGIPWAKEALQAEKNPVELSIEEMEKFVGDYGPRRITLREGRLYYQREGRPEYRLKPLTKDMFALEGYTPFRVRFASDTSGKVTKIIGLYIAGNIDESPRNR
jgi:CubicO group peptidase (beta-lactamase class C family)